MALPQARTGKGARGSCEPTSELTQNFNSLASRRKARNRSKTTTLDQKSSVLLSIEELRNSSVLRTVAVENDSDLIKLAAGASQAEQLQPRFRKSCNLPSSLLFVAGKFSIQRKFAIMSGVGVGKARRKYFIRHGTVSITPISDEEKKLEEGESSWVPAPSGPCCPLLKEDIENQMPPVYVTYHRMWRRFSSELGTDVQAEGFKAAIVDNGNGWFVGSALVLTIGFSLLAVDTSARSESSIEDDIATLIFVFLVILSIVSSSVGIFVGAHFVEDMTMVPAALYGELGCSMQQQWNHITPFRWTHLSVLALSLSTVPLCYLMHGRIASSFAFVGHFVFACVLENVQTMRLRMWRKLEQTIRLPEGEHLALAGWRELSRREKIKMILKKSFLLDRSTLPLLLESLHSLLFSVEEGVTGRK